MKKSEGLQSLQRSLSGLPQWASERILQQINQLAHYEPVIGIMGKTGAGKSSLCNAPVCWRGIAGQRCGGLYP